MTGPSVAKRPQSADREHSASPAPARTAERRDPPARAMFATWTEAFRHVSVWLVAGLMVYALLAAGWLILR